MSTFSTIPIADDYKKLDVLLSKFNINRDIFRNIDTASLSGGSVIQLYESSIDEIKQVNINDLDIYMKIKQYKSNIKDLVFNLIEQGYRCKSSYYSSKADSYEYMLKKFLKFNKAKKYNVKKTNTYFSLKKYINGVITLYNKNIKKSIDFIITRVNIKNLLTKTFDFDIVKNYINISYGNCIKMLNKSSIDTKIATMSIPHFKNRVLDNIYEFNNFITRYMKYSNKGYTIYIGKQLITRKVFNTIVLNFMRLCPNKSDTTFELSETSQTVYTSYVFEKTQYKLYMATNNQKSYIKHNVYRNYVKENYLFLKFNDFKIKDIILTTLKLARAHLEIKDIILKPVNKNINNVKFDKLEVDKLEVDNQLSNVMNNIHLEIFDKVHELIINNYAKEFSNKNTKIKIKDIQLNINLTQVNKTDEEDFELV